MQRVMGHLPSSARRIALDVQVHSEEDAGSYVRQQISFATEPRDRVQAFLLIPKEIDERCPAMLCLHQTVKAGKREPAGLAGAATLHYAHELAQRKYVCLVPDYPSFGDYPYDFPGKGKHWPSGTLKAVWNNSRALDLLESWPIIDSRRIGCIGHSLGGHNAIFTAVFDQRIRAVVSSCGFNAFHRYFPRLEFYRAGNTFFFLIPLTLVVIILGSLFAPTMHTYEPLSSDIERPAPLKRLFRLMFPGLPQFARDPTDLAIGERTGQRVPEGPGQ